MKRFTKRTIPRNNQHYRPFCHSGVQRAASVWEWTGWIQSGTSLWNPGRADLSGIPVWASQTNMEQTSGTTALETLKILQETNYWQKFLECFNILLFKSHAHNDVIWNSVISEVFKLDKSQKNDWSWDKSILLFYIYK